MASNTLGLQLSHANRDGVDLLLDALQSAGDVDTFKVGEGTYVIAPVNEEVAMAVEDNADELDIDHARLKLMAVNTVTMQTSPADAIAKQFNEENGYDSGNDYPLSQVSDLIDFMLNEADTSKLDTPNQSSTPATSATSVETTTTAAGDDTVVTSTATTEAAKPQTKPNSQQTATSETPVDVPASTAEQHTNGLFDTKPIGQVQTDAQSKPTANTNPVYDPNSNQLTDPKPLPQTPAQNDNRSFDDNFGADPQTNAQPNNQPQTDSQGFDDNFGADNAPQTSPDNAQSTLNNNQGNTPDGGSNGFDDNFGANAGAATQPTNGPASSADSLDLSGWDDFGMPQQGNMIQQPTAPTTQPGPAPQNTPAVEPAVAPDSGDEMLKRAADMFDNQYHLTMPQMDEQTKHDLMTEYTAANNDLTKIRNQAIYAIRDRLREIKERTENRVRQSDLFETAEKNHDNTLKTIKSNLSVDITNTQNDSQQAYQNARNQWVEAQRPQLESQYDSEHLAKHQTVVKTKIETLKKKADEDTDTENKKFNQYTENSLKSAVDNEIEHANIDDIIKRANAQGRHTLNHLQKSADKYHSDLAEAQAESKRLKDQLEQLQALRDQQVAAEKSKAELTAKQEYDRQAAEKDKQMQELQKKLEEADKHNKDMQDMVHDAKTQRDTYSAQQKQMNETLAQIREMQTRSDERERRHKHDDEQAKTQQMLQQALSQDKHRLGAGWKAAIVSTLILALAAVGVGGTAYLHNEHEKPAPQTVTVQQPASSSSSSQSSSSSSSSSDDDAYKPGDTFKYTTQDGEKVTVTVDTPHSGHYTGSDGQQHSIIWNN